MGFPPIPPQYSFLAPKGDEDIPWWQSNKVRIAQSMALGTIGGVTHVNAGLQPVAILEDLSDLSDSSALFAFGACVYPFNGFTAILEVAAPSGPVNCFVHACYASARNAPVEVSVRIVTPGTVGQHAYITGGAQQLDDGWTAYGRRHQSATFAGFRAAGPGLVQGTVAERRGFCIAENAGASGRMLWEPNGRMGLRIPQGRNFVMDTSFSGLTQGTPTWLSVLVRETQPPGGPVGADAGPGAGL